MNISKVWVWHKDKWDKFSENVIKVSFIIPNTITKATVHIHDQELDLEGLRKIVKTELVMDGGDEYDPEQPYQGRPEQKLIPGKIPFTGYFDPILQRYTIQNFNQNTFQTREEAEPTIVMTDRPEYLK